MTDTTTRVQSARRGVPISGTGFGPATQLLVLTQPVGAVTDIAFTTQPAVRVCDAQGNTRTSSTAEVTASKASGSGTLGGDTAVNAVAGVATFTDLEIVGTGDHALAFASSGLTGATSSTFDVVGEPPSELTAQFFSDWTSEVGVTVGAKGDGGKWGAVGDSDGGLSVVTGHGLAFPTANILRVNLRHNPPLYGGDGFHRLGATGLGVTGDTGSRYIRFYHRHMEAHDDGLGTTYQDADQHPIESGQTGGFCWIFNTVSVSNTEWYCYLQTQTGAFWQRRWRSPNLTIGTVYRFEIQIEGVSSTTFRYHARVAECSGTLPSVTETPLYDDEDFYNRDAGDGHSVGDTTLADDTILTYEQKSQMDEVRAGCNGKGNGGTPSGTPPNWPDGLHFADQAGFAVCDDQGWIGGYGNVAGEG